MKYIIKKQYRNKLKIKNRKNIIAYSIFERTLHNSRGDFIEREYKTRDLEFLLKHKNNLNLVSEIDAFFFELFKNYNSQFLDRIKKYNKAQYKDYHIYYLQNKCFEIKNKNKRNIFFDINNITETTLSDACDIFGISRGLDNPNLTQRIKQVGEKIQDFLISLDCYSTKWYSVGKISENYFINKCQIPTINNIDEKIIREFYSAYKGNWIDIFKKGSFKNIYSYDIKSAYPYAMSKMIDINKGFWTRNVDKIDKCYYGVLDVIVDVPLFVIPAITVRDKTNYNPVGRFRIKITKQEFEVCQKYIKKINSFYGFIPYEYKYFLKDEIENLFKLKKQNILAKKILVALYGKFCQLNGRRQGVFETGNLFNPIYASFITSYTRKKIWDVINKNQDSIISINTDGVYSTKKLKIDSGSSLGAWTCQKWDSAIFITNGLYCLSNENDSKQALRGYQDLNLLELLKNNLDKSLIPITESQQMSIRQALIMKGFDISFVNKYIETNKNININSDVKRLFPRVKNVRELLRNSFNSIPIRYERRA